MSNALQRQPTLAPAAPRGRLERVRAGTEGISEFLVFSLGTERMGLPLASVHEILKPTTPTHVPRAPRDVLGILSVRGRITTVLDLRRRLGMSEVPPTRHTRILLVDGDIEVMGILVDAVLQVVRLRDDEIEGSAVVAADLPEHVLGLGRPRRIREGTRGAGSVSEANSALGAAKTTVDEPRARGMKSSLATEGDPSEGRDAEVIVLLDPVALLRR